MSSFRWEAIISFAALIVSILTLWNSCNDSAKNDERMNEYKQRLQTIEKSMGGYTDSMKGIKSQIHEMKKDISNKKSE